MKNFLEGFVAGHMLIVAIFCIGILYNQPVITVEDYNLGHYYILLTTILSGIYLNIKFFNKNKTEE